MSAIAPGVGFGRRSPLLVLALTLAAAVTCLLLYARPDKLQAAFASFRWQLLPLLVALVALDYGVRFFRWRLLFRIAIGRALPVGDDCALFLAGTTMIVTPGRVGEWIKSYYAQRLFNVPASRTAPIPLLERIADLGAMALLAGTAAVAMGRGVVVLGAASAASLVILLMAVMARRSRISALQRVPSVRRAAAACRSFSEAAGSLARPAPALSAIGFGLVAWAVECLAFFLVLVGFGLEANLSLLAAATFVYPVATLAGTFSFLPGGVIIAEGGIASLTIALTGAPLGVAAGAALVVRALIVGGGVIAGLWPAALLARRASSLRPTAATTTASATEEK